MNKVSVVLDRDSVTNFAVSRILDIEIFLSGNEVQDVAERQRSGHPEGPT